MNQNISTDTLNLCRRLPSIERNNSQKLLQLQKTWQATDASLQEQLNYRPASRAESSSRKKKKQKIIKEAFKEPCLRIAQIRDCQSSTESEEEDIEQVIED